VTGDLFQVTDPAWDPEGKVLYALSRRGYAPQISNLEFDFAGNRNVDVIAYALRKNRGAPLPPQPARLVEQQPQPGGAGGLLPGPPGLPPAGHLAALPH